MSGLDATAGGKPEERVHARLELTARRSSLAVVRSITESLLRASPWHEIHDDRLREVLLVVLEACSNVAMHAYDQEGGGPLLVELELDRERLRVQVIDQGPGFDLAEATANVGKNHGAVRGYGLFLMEGLTDSLIVEKTAGGNVVSMTRSLADVRQASTRRVGEAV